MPTTALVLPLTVPPWHKPTCVVRVLPRSRPRRGPGPAVTRPQSKWTVLAAFVLAVILHLAPVAIVEMSLERPWVEITQAFKHDTAPRAVD
jgi:hypothetical protein